MYYKLIGNGTILDVMENPQFVTYQERNQIMILCELKEARGVLSSDGSTVWHVDGWKPIPLPGVETAQLIEIDEDEYEVLKSAIGSPDVPTQPTEEELIDPADITLGYVQERKIKEMNKACEAAIVAGVDVELSDGETHHFDLTIEDQINLISLKEEIMAGSEQIPYHESGQLCRMFPSGDIAILLQAAANHKTYHVTYFNSLKNYINQLHEIDAVNNIRYGTIIPEPYCSDVLLAITEGNQ